MFMIKFWCCCQTSRYLHMVHPNLKKFLCHHTYGCCNRCPGTIIACSCLLWCCKPSTKISPLLFLQNLIFLHYPLAG
ncbi:hypothetical protein V6Z11_D10G084600 [Gossypium hirsutum]